MKRAEFGKRLKLARRERNISSETLSELCGTSAVFIRQIESAAKIPSLPTLIKICNALSASPDFLLADSLLKQKADSDEMLLNKLKTLPPKKFELVLAMVDTLSAAAEP